MLRLVIFLSTAFVTVSALADPYFLSREEWLRRVRKDINETLCENSGYLRTCTNVAANCKQTVENASDQCVAKIKFPKKIDPFDNGLNFGNQLGQCIGAKLERVAQRRPATMESVCGHGI